MASKGENGGRRGGDGGRYEAAGYLAGAIADLALIARRHRLDLLAYLLDMAHLETEEILRLGPDGNSTAP
jgi:hypothetical protein